MSNILKFGIPATIGISALSIGAFTGLHSYENDTENEGGQKIGHAVANAGAGVLYGGLAIGVGTGIVKSSAKKAGSSISKAFSSATPINKEFFNRTSVAAGGGVLLGGLIGSQLDKDNPTAGAVIGTVGGAAAGVAIKSAVKGVNLWNKIGPVGRVATVIGGSLAIAGYARSKRDLVYESSDITESDGFGGHNISSGVKDRLNSMNAQGDVVFGLNNKRR